MLGLIGPNGSGKTTLVNCLSGVHMPDGGTIEFESRDITRWSSTRRARAGLLRTFQNLRLFGELTVGENVEAGQFTGRAPRGPGAAAAMLEEMGLQGKARTVSSGLSYGEQRRVEIGRARAGEPRLLLLDEPGAGLSDVDRAGLHHRLVEIRDRTGCAMIVIDHDMPFILGLCTRILVLHEGRIIYAGDPEGAVADKAVVEAYLGSREPEIA
jgi:ABC-type branched-subunit amino acid transport system ATPase component